MVIALILFSFIFLSSACFAIDTVNTVEPEISVVFQEPVKVTATILKHVDSGRVFDVNLTSEIGGMDFKFRPAKALNNGQYLFTIFARDLVGNSNSYDYGFQVYVPGTEIILRKPNPIGVANSTTFEVMISTTRPSVCKYTGITVPSFNDVRLKLFDITGSVGDGNYVTDHTLLSYTAEPGFPRRFFVACLDDLGRENFKDFTLYADITSPRLDSVIFSPAPVVEYPPEGGLYSQLQVMASEPVLCRYTDDPETVYSLMTPFAGYAVNDFDAYKEHNDQRIDFPGDTVKDTFTYYVQCMDRAGFLSAKLTKDITVDLTAGLQITVVSPPAFSRNTAVFLNVTTNRNAFCVYKSAAGGDGDPSSYTDPAAALSSSFESLSRTHYKDLGTRASGSHSISIRCDVPEGVGLEPMNAEKSFTYVIDTEPPSIPLVNATTPVCYNTLSASFSANDSQSGISGYQWQVGAAGKVFANGTTSDDSVSVSKYLNGSDFILSDTQTYSFVVSAIDGAGNIGQTGVSNRITYDATGISCDRTPPAVTIIKTEDGSAATLECIDEASGCSLIGSYYSTTYQEPCNATQPFFDNPTTIPLFRTTIICWSIKDNAGNVNIGSKTLDLNSTEAGISGNPCPNGIDNDGDGYGERCLLGFDCDDTDPDRSVGCPNGCIQDLDGDGYGMGCTAGNDCNGRNPNLTTSCPNGCISDNDGDQFGLGCNNGPDCKGDDSTLTINCPNGCIDDNDGDGYGMGCPAGFDCQGEDYRSMITCDSGCVQDTDGDSFGVVCLLGLDCNGWNPSTTTGCSNGCTFDEDGDGYGFGCNNGLDCNGMNQWSFTGCSNNCISDNDGDYYGWGCDNGADCNDTDPFVNLDCSMTTDCVYDHDGDGYGLGCRIGPDCDDYDLLLTSAECTANCTYDEDCNGLPDEWQMKHFNSTICDDPAVCGPDADPDGDGYTNIEEYRRGTDPLTKDVVELPPERSRESIDNDGDGMPDACEKRYGLNPSDPYDAAKDPDGDGLDNGFECNFKEGMCVNWLNPTSPDTDNDGYDDGVEIDAETDPCDPDSHPSAGMLPWLLVIIGLLAIVGSTAYLIYRKYYVPLVSPPPKPTAVPRAAQPAARPAGVPPPGARPSRPRRLPPRRPSGPAMSKDLFEREMRKRAEERERILSAFGERKRLPKPEKAEKVMEKLARKPAEVRKVSIVRPEERPAPAGPAKVDHISRLSKLVGKDHFEKLDSLSKQEADYFGKLATIAKQKEVPLEDDQVSKLASVTKRVVEDKEKKKELVTAFRKSDMERLDEFLTTGKHVDTFIKEAPAKAASGKDAFEELSGIAGGKGVEALEDLSAKKRKDVMEELSELSTRGAKKEALAKMEKLTAAGSKDEIFRTFSRMAKEKHVDKNVFEVLLSYLLKSGKVTKNDVSGILFSLEEEGVLEKKDVAEVFFNLGIKS